MRHDCVELNQNTLIASILIYFVMIHLKIDIEMYMFKLINISHVIKKQWVFSKTLLLEEIIYSSIQGLINKNHIHIIFAEYKCIENNKFLRFNIHS